MKIAFENFRFKKMSSINLEPPSGSFKIKYKNSEFDDFVYIETNSDKTYLGRKADVLGTISSDKYAQHFVEQLLERGIKSYSEDNSSFNTVDITVFYEKNSIDSKFLKKLTEFKKSDDNRNRCLQIRNLDFLNDEYLSLDCYGQPTYKGISVGTEERINTLENNWNQYFRELFGVEFHSYEKIGSGLMFSSLDALYNFKIKVEDIRKDLL